MPLILKVLTPPEMKALVGDIMGKRPAELMRSILDMSVRHLDREDRDAMLKHMRRAAEGTFFETVRHRRRRAPRPKAHSGTGA